MARAASLAENILHDHFEALSGGVTLLPGSDGIFEVHLDDRLIFSKEELERFPEENEVEELLEELLEV